MPTIERVIDEPTLSPASLLGDDEPPAYEIRNAGGRAPVLMVADHASNRIPRSLSNLGLDSEQLLKHVAWDIGSALVARALSRRIDAPLVEAGYSRLVVDLNRGLSDPTVMPEVSDGIVIPGNCALDSEQRRLRVHDFYMPYRRAIDEQLSRFRKRGVVPAFIAIHSFTPEMSGTRRPWKIGVLWDKDPRIPVPLMERLRAHPAGIVVGDNEPYSGRHPADYTIDHHAEAHGFAHVSIEVRQDLISDPDGAEHWAGILYDCLSEILEEPGLYEIWQR